ncbi:Cache 3/Cache 2 fusion domain-containing protein [Salinispira pacifica]
MLITIVLATAGVMVYKQVEQIIYESTDANLDSMSDLIKRIVQVSIENNRGQVSKDLIVAEHFVGNSVEIDRSGSFSCLARNTINEKVSAVKLPLMRIGGEVVSGRDGLVDRIAEETGDIVTIYQYCDQGLISIATNAKDEKGQPRVGELIPTGAPLDTLVKRESPYFGRDYFNHEWYLTAFRRLYQDGKPVGALYVAIQQTDLQYLRDDILSIRIGKKGRPYIIDTLGMVVIHSTLEGQNLWYLDHVKELIFQKDGVIRHSEVDPLTHRREEYITYFKYVPEMNWIVVVGSTMSDFFGGLYALRSVMLITIAIAMLAALAAGGLLGTRIVRPIRVISRRLREISEGEADPGQRLFVRTNDEVGDLARYFNRFLGKLEDLFRLERRQIEVSLKNAQMNALQAQINPHFLYNTLETIRFLIGMQDRRAVQMVQHLGDLFRVSVGGTQHFVSVRQEIEHVKLYMAIHDIRYPGSITVSYDFSDEVLGLRTIRFLLQPIIENSIIHGFDGREEGCRIRISGRIEEDVLVVRVSDNGCGLEDHRLVHVQRQLRGQEPGEGVGLQNISGRIRLQFGERYGLWIESAAGEMTTVTARLPVLRVVSGRPEGEPEPEEQMPRRR